MQQHRAQILDDQKKRPAPTEPTDGLDNSKRLRLDATLPTQMAPAGHPSGIPEQRPISLAQLFTLTRDPATAIDISAIPKHTVDQLIVPLIRSVDRQRLDVAVNVRIH